MADKAPAKQTLSNAVIFFVPYLRERIQTNPQKNTPIVNESAPIPAPLLNISTTAVACRIVHINQVKVWGLVLSKYISLIYGMKLQMPIMEAITARTIFMEFTV